MPYSSYSDPTWTVIHAAPDSKCQRGNHIRFAGTPDKVIIDCNGSVPYLEGVYVDGFNTIERADDYEIRMSPPSPPGHRTIFFTQKGSSDSTGGSWTAEDYTPGPGEG